MTRTALLVIDLLEDFLRAWDAPGRARLLRATNELIGMARERDVPVIWVRQEFEEIGARAVILAGVNTHACVRMTAIDAYQRDFEVIVARECVGSYDREHEAVTLRYLDCKIASVLDNAQVRRRLEIGMTA